jgi:putative addiction module component (TIGR02574 family)
MGKPRDKLETEVMKLPPEDRAELAQRLIESLEGGDVGDYESDWVQEAERRYEQYRKGVVKGKSAEEVFREAKARLE